LDENSRYCNLLQASHFRDTAIVAEHDGQLHGFVTGYRVPGRENVLFIWQVGVSPDGRGRGLGQQMLHKLVERVSDVTTLETTVTPDNEASAAMFERLARSLNAPIEQSVMFENERHFDGEHDDEILYRIGPFDASSLPECGKGPPSARA
jgi:L-2,4-diaminobutyric acid acetyltransferase